MLDMGKVLPPIVFTSVFIDEVDMQPTDDATAVVTVVVIVTEEHANAVVTVD